MESHTREDQPLARFKSYDDDHDYDDCDDDEDDDNVDDDDAGHENCALFQQRLLSLGHCRDWGPIHVSGSE